MLVINSQIDDLLDCELPNPKAHYFCPYRVQAKRVAWQYVKDYTAHIPGTRYNESELVATLPGNRKYYLMGCDNIHVMRGEYSDSCALDEYGQMSPLLFGQVIRPLLSDRLGRCYFLGTPFGRMNDFHEKYKQADEPENQDTWMRCLLNADQTGHISQDELDACRRESSKEEFQQEFMCSWDAAIRGAFYAKDMEDAQAEGRICGVPWQRDLPVFLSFDLGMDDSTAVWFWQTVGREIHAIEYAEYQGTHFPDLFADLKSRPYQYGTVLLPHDAKVREMAVRGTRIDQFLNAGFDAVIVPKVDPADGINAFRTMLNKIWFDADKCQQGIEFLRLYRTAYDPEKRVYSRTPLHDFTSHCADSARYMAVGYDMTRQQKMRLDYTQLHRAAG